jgi:hypothetical protein
MNLEQQLSEISKKLRKIGENNCCSHNSFGQVEISAGAVTSKTFVPGTFHSVSWLVDSGSVDISITGQPTVEYTNAGVMSVSQLNGQTVTFTIVTGTTKIQWNY